MEWNLRRMESELRQINPDLLQPSKSFKKPSSGTITINVGGYLYAAQRHTLAKHPGSLLEEIVMGKKPVVHVDSMGNTFIDRDGPIFRHVLNFLRMGELVLPDDFKEAGLLRREANFYRLSELAQALQDWEQQQSQLSSQGRSTQFVTSTNVPPNLQSDPQSSLIQNGSKEPGPQPAVTTLSSVMPTPQEDAQLLLQHPTLLTQPKPAGGEVASQVGTSRGPEGSGGVNALTASASLLKSLPVDGEEDGSSGASVVAIDNKIEQAMDLVKSHLMYAVREEVEVLKEQIKELIERNSQLEQENNLLKNLASPEQLAQFQAQVQSGSPPPGSSSTQGAQPPPAAPPAQLSAQSSGPSA
uniref:TSC22 domain family protein 1 n=1 Tax=Cyprinus carpio carpio TaxID=630221 RepID=A0A9J8AHH0_CYPCA